LEAFGEVDERSKSIIAFRPNFHLAIPSCVARLRSPDIYVSVNVLSRWEDYGIADCGLRIADFPTSWSPLRNPKSAIRNPQSAFPQKVTRRPNWNDRGIPGENEPPPRPNLLVRAPCGVPFTVPAFPLKKPDSGP